jgi:hypothetical protein
MVVKRNRATRNHCHEALREFLNSRFISVWVEGRGGVPGRYRRLWYQDVSTARNLVSAEIKPRSVSSVPVISSPLRSDFNLGKYSAAKLQEQTETRESVPKGMPCAGGGDPKSADGLHPQILGNVRGAEGAAPGPFSGVLGSLAERTNGWLATQC